MITKKNLSNALLLTSFSVLTACGGGSNANFEAADVELALKIPFQAKSGTTDINCDAELLQLGTTADSATISTFAYYIHDVELVTANGNIAFTLDANEFQDSEYGVALLDYQDKNSFCSGNVKPTNKEISGTVSSDVDLSEVIGLDFKLGIPSAINHRDLTTNMTPYNVQSMFWSWNTGHKFMRLDINPSAQVSNGTDTASTRNFHLGSTGCTGDATTGEVVTCSNENQGSISLTDFKVVDSEASAVVLDLAELLVGSDINTDNGGPLGCMSFASDPECPVMFKNLGIDFDGTPSVSEQTVFSVEQSLSLQ